MKKFYGHIDTADYEDIDIYDYNYDFADDDEYRKIGSVRTLFTELDIDYYKPIRTDRGFAEQNDNYMEYTSKGDRYENLSPKEHLNIIRPCLRDLINKHKPTVIVNNNNNNNNSNNNDNNNTDNNTDNNNTDTNNNNNNNRAEWKIQLIIKNNFISVKDFKDIRSIYSASKPTEIFMGSGTKNVFDMLFDSTLNKI